MVQFWWLKESVSISSLGTWKILSTATLSLKPLPCGDCQTIHSTELCKWLHCQGQIERKKRGLARGIEKQGETKRSGSVVWRGQERIKGPGADLWPLSVRQPWLHLTSFRRSAKSTGISSYTEAVPCGDTSVPPLQPFHLEQNRRWKWMGGAGLCLAPTCQRSTTKGAEPSIRMPGSQVLPYYKALTVGQSYLPIGSHMKATAWRESEEGGSISGSSGDGKLQLCGKQRWTYLPHC